MDIGKVGIGVQSGRSLRAPHRAAVAPLRTLPTTAQSSPGYRVLDLINGCGSGHEKEGKAKGQITSQQLCTFKPIRPAIACDMSGVQDGQRAIVTRSHRHAG
jgi:hypothetical protein